MAYYKAAPYAKIGIFSLAIGVEPFDESIIKAEGRGDKLVADMLRTQRNPTQEVNPNIKVNPNIDQNLRYVVPERTDKTAYDASIFSLETLEILGILAGAYIAQSLIFRPIYKILEKKGENIFPDKFVEKYNTMVEEGFLDNPLMKEELKAGLKNYAKTLRKNPEDPAVMEEMRAMLWNKTTEKLAKFTKEEIAEFNKITTQIASEMNITVDENGIMYDKNTGKQLSKSQIEVKEKMIDRLKAEAVKYKNNLNKKIIGAYEEAFSQALEELGIDSKIWNNAAREYAKEKVLAFQNFMDTSPAFLKIEEIVKNIGSAVPKLFKNVYNFYKPISATENLANLLEQGSNEFYTRLAQNTKIQNWIKKRYNISETLTTDSYKKLIKDHMLELKNDETMFNEMKKVAGKSWSNTLKRGGITVGIVALGIGIYMLLDYIFGEDENKVLKVNISETGQPPSTVPGFQSPTGSYQYTDPYPNYLPDLKKFPLAEGKDWAFYVTPVSNAEIEIGTKKTYSIDVEAPPVNTENGGYNSVYLGVQPINRQGYRQYLDISGFPEVGIAEGRITFGVNANNNAGRYEPGRKYNLSLTIDIPNNRPASYGYRITDKTTGEVVSSKDNIPITAREWKTLLQNPQDFKVYVGIFVRKIVGKPNEK